MDDNWKSYVVLSHILAQHGSSQVSVSEVSSCESHLTTLESGVTGHTCCGLERKPLAQVQSPAFSCSSVLWPIPPVVSVPLVWCQGTNLNLAHEPSKGETLQTVRQMPWDVNVAPEEHKTSQTRNWNRSSEIWQKCCPCAEVRVGSEGWAMKLQTQVAYKEYFIKMNKRRWSW